MPRKAPPSLFDYINRFLENIQPHQIMFCKPYWVREEWNIGAGAVLDISMAHPRLVQICRALYENDKTWFIGDIDSLLSYGNTET